MSNVNFSLSLTRIVPFAAEVASDVVVAAIHGELPVRSQAVSVYRHQRVRSFTVIAQANHPHRLPAICPRADRGGRSS